MLRPDLAVVVAKVVKYLFWLMVLSFYHFVLPVFFPDSMTTKQQFIILPFKLVWLMPFFKVFKVSPTSSLKQFLDWRLAWAHI